MLRHRRPARLTSIAVAAIAASHAAGGGWLRPTAANAQSLAATIAGVPEHAREWNAPDIAWRDMAAGVQEAIRTGKPALMVMHATWCTACRRYREAFKDARVVSLSRKFVMILIDVQRYPDVNGAFAPDGTYVPRTLFIDADGEVDRTLIGSDPQYPHSLKIDSADELAGLMERARSPVVLTPTAPPQSEARQR